MLTYEFYTMAFDLAPIGPDRTAVISHWTTVFNHIVHYIIHDEDGAQKSEVFWALELVRRAMHVACIDYKKTQYGDFESTLDTVFDSIRKLINTVWAGDPAKRIAAETAAKKLRKLVGKKSKQRRWQA